MRPLRLIVLRNYLGVALFSCAVVPNIHMPAWADPPDPRPIDRKSFYGTPLARKDLEGGQLPAETSPFPKYNSAKSTSTRAREQRNKMVWSAPTPQEQSMLQAVTDSQLQQGADDPRTLNLMWTTAQYFLKVQKIQQAEPLLKELIAIIESHSQTTANAQILSDAKFKLKEIQDARIRPVLPQWPRFMPPLMTPRTGLRGGNAKYVDARNP